MNFGLSEELAHAIVKRTMDVIPYNINVMNNEGIIIASGDESREGYLHQGALKAIQRNGIFEVTTETITEKMGVNLPILYGNEIIGVIGISGDPKEVRPLVYVIKVIAELMIEQQYALNKDMEQKMKFENFIREWCSVPRERVSQKFIEQALSLHVNIDIPRVAVLLSVKKARGSLINYTKEYLGSDEYAVRYQENVLILFRDTAALSKRLENILKVFPQVEMMGVGEAGTNVAESVIKASKSLAVLKGMSHPSSKIMYFNDCLIQDMVLSYKDSNSFASVISELNKQAGSDYLVQTIVSYLKYFGNVNRIADDLHIHRNTLSYRMQKIEEYTGKDLHNMHDLLFFYIACIASGIELN